MRTLHLSRNIKALLILASIAMLCFILTKSYWYIDPYFSEPDADSLEPGFNDADKFIKYGYPEIKSLSIQLLTLLTAILVFSVTFSEKIVNYSQTRNSIRLILVTGWTLLIFAIAADGIGLAYNAFALPYALTDLHTAGQQPTTSTEFYEPAFNAIKAILMSGVFFIAGLICIVLAGIISIFYQAKTELK